MSEPAAAPEEIHGKLADGRKVRIFTLTNTKGLRARISEYGAILVSLEAPDARGQVADLTHGFDTLEDWVRHNDPCFGATIGRYGNRIAAGRFTLDGQTHHLRTNNAPGGIPCALHGGERGFHKVLWKGKRIDPQTIELRYSSAEGEEGYPGKLEAIVSYRLNDDNELKWEATATTDAPTVVNLLHHSYWNLSGDPTTTILDHQLTLQALHYLPTNEGLIPTGEIAPVAGTPMDFTRPHAIGSRLNADFEPLRFGKGYDHCWVLPPCEGVQLAARVTDPGSGRILEVFTDQPGIQFYAANFLDGSDQGKGGVAYGRHSALCLETQNFPDAPNQPSFPSPVLR
ncbi:MAG: aldose epimerase family protein, partial [Akkermansiaceae bacterium]|nr:aldose epimerase family protein [Akkermansiaceae bacterium]